MFKNREIRQLNISTSEGDIGILANHVPSIHQLVPGPITALSSSDQGEEETYYVSGGFVIVNPDAKVDVKALDAYPLDQFDWDRIQVGLKDAEAQLGKTSGKPFNDPERSSAVLQSEIYKSLAYTLDKFKTTQK